MPTIAENQTFSVKHIFDVDDAKFYWPTVKLEQLPLKILNTSDLSIIPAVLTVEVFDSSGQLLCSYFTE